MDRTTVGLVLVSAVALILPVMALFGRKIPVVRLAGMALLWIAMFAMAWLTVRMLDY